MSIKTFDCKWQKSNPTQIILSKKGYVLMHITGKKRDEWVLGITVHRFSKMGEDSNSWLDFPLSVATFFSPPYMSFLLVMGGRCTRPQTASSSLACDPRKTLVFHIRLKEVSLVSHINSQRRVQWAQPEESLWTRSGTMIGQAWDHLTRVGSPVRTPTWSRKGKLIEKKMRCCY